MCIANQAALLLPKVPAPQTPSVADWGGEQPPRQGLSLRCSTDVDAAGGEQTEKG